MSYRVLDFKTLANEITNRKFTDFYYRLMLLALVRFKWTNLPNGISEKWIEKYLYHNGSCMFYMDDNLGFTVAECTEEGVNNYDEPVTLRPVANGILDVRPYKNGEEAILICNNDLKIPTRPTIELFAYDLANISRTIDINVNAQKYPVFVACSDKQRLTLKNVFKQWDGFEPVIFGDKSLDIDSMKAINVQAPIVFDKLQIQKHAVWNECMTFLGIQNANQDKKERVVDDEVRANDEQIEMGFHTMFRARKEACKLINELFDTNIDVEPRIDLEAFLKGFEEGSEDGSEPLGRSA